ncbi:hypothetical protein LC612_36190 [Nostoc sp. CHAB 5834]|nr:hypothetical protein [Nostoc sp. CHAB 5834]
MKYTTAKDRSTLVSKVIEAVVAAGGTCEPPKVDGRCASVRVMLNGGLEVNVEFDGGYPHDYVVLNWYIQHAKKYAHVKLNPDAFEGSVNHVHFHKGAQVHYTVEALLDALTRMAQLANTGDLYQREPAVPH